MAKIRAYKLAEEFGIDGGNVAFAIPGALRIAFGFLFDGCNAESPDSGDEFIPHSDGVTIMNFASAGAFEEILHCSSTATEQLAGLKSKFGDDADAWMEMVP